MNYTITTRYWKVIQVNGEIHIMAPILEKDESVDISNSDTLSSDAITVLAKEVGKQNEAAIEAARVKVLKGEFDLNTESVPQKIISNVKP